MRAFERFGCGDTQVPTQHDVVHRHTANNPIDLKANMPVRRDLALARSRMLQHIRISSAKQIFPILLETKTLQPDL
jgi:hypothetical protein